ncbi:hypothetical protein L6164_005898 [Bauhinia variegata]|uniref:Uncharacterized protein n=1 Tax=Bauhinia variegata TaxID=167791 RepID=A0ACB9PT73_BAUVA|nr:hypothetical protein L6164_005898 [Bauhinia variegata]
MAGSDPQRELLSLFRIVASEKSQGERRIVTLTKKIEELKSALSEANAELEDVKRSKELVEQELKGYEVQLSMSEALVQTLQPRVSLIQDEISSVGCDLEDLKNEEAALREEFINRMLVLNAEIRKFHGSVTCNIDAVDSASYEDGAQGIMKENDAEDSLSTIENKLADILARTTKEEEEYEAKKNIHKKVQQELIDWERKVSLMHMMIKETKALQDLTIYPF